LATDPACSISRRYNPYLENEKVGYLLFGTTSLIIALYQLFATKISPLTTAFYIALILFFGFFLKKLR